MTDMKPEQLELAIIEEWQKLKKPTDVAEIAAKANVSTQTVYNVFHRKKVTSHLFAIMQEYYLMRKLMLHDAFQKIKLQTNQDESK